MRELYIGILRYALGQRLFGEHRKMRTVIACPTPESQSQTRMIPYQLHGAITYRAAATSEGNKVHLGNGITGRSSLC